jgi:serine/threonine protein kinase
MGASSSREKTRLPHDIVLTDNILGEGSYGKVYEGYYQSDPSSLLAIKEFDNYKLFKLEFEVAKELKDHFRKCPEYFMCMVDYFMYPSRDLYYIVYKRAKSDLTTYMKHLGVRDKGFSKATPQNPYDVFYVSNLEDTTAYNVINTMIVILEKLDSLKLSHRDIKMENILVDYGFPINIILGDMGLMCSRRGSPIKLAQCSKSSVQGTHMFFPPSLENVWNSSYTSEKQALWQDIYATGATLYAFLAGMFPKINRGSPLLDFPRDLKPVIDGVKYRIRREDINKLVNTMVFAPSVDLALRYKNIWRKYKNLKRKSKKTKSSNKKKKGKKKI